MAVATRSRSKRPMPTRSRPSGGGGNSAKEASARSRAGAAQHKPAATARPNATKFSLPNGQKLPLRVPDDVDKLIDQRVTEWNKIAAANPCIPTANRSQMAIGSMARGLENVGDFIREMGGDVTAAKKVADTRSTKQMKDEAHRAKKG